MFINSGGFGKESMHQKWWKYGIQKRIWPVNLKADKDYWGDNNET